MAAGGDEAVGGGGEADDGRIKTYADPRPPYGHIGLVLRRD